MICIFELILDVKIRIVTKKIPLLTCYVTTYQMVSSNALYYIYIYMLRIYEYSFHIGSQ